MKVCKKVTSVFALVLILSLLIGVTGASAATRSLHSRYRKQSYRKNVLS